MQFLCRHRDPQRHNCPSPSTSRLSAGSSSGRSRRAHSKSPFAVTTSAMSTSATGSSDAAPTARASAVSKISSSASSPLMLANSILVQLSDFESSADARTLPPRGGQRRASHRDLGPARGVRGAGLKAPRMRDSQTPTFHKKVPGRFYSTLHFRYRIHLYWRRVHSCFTWPK